MKLYLGSRDYSPEGFLTVDIDPRHGADIVADVADLCRLRDESVDEIMASHILEHLPWPVAFKALMEWARVLRRGGRLSIAVPDLKVLAKMICDARNPWWAMGIVYGVGRLENALEAHQYGYTFEMVQEMLETLGFSDFDWWKHDLPDASNGWMLDVNGERIALSMNITAKKSAVVPTRLDELYQALLRERLRPFDQVKADWLMNSNTAPPEDNDSGTPLIVQRLHMALIEARMRIKYLEDKAAGL